MISEISPTLFPSKTIMIGNSSLEFIAGSVRPYTLPGVWPLFAIDRQAWQIKEAFRKYVTGKRISNWGLGLGLVASWYPPISTDSKILKRIPIPPKKRRFPSPIPVPISIRSNNSSLFYMQPDFRQENCVFNSCVAFLDSFFWRKMPGTSKNVGYSYWSRTVILRNKISFISSIALTHHHTT